MNTAVAQANRVLLRRLSLIALAMFGFGFALVPLYDVLCDITGLNRGDIQALARNTQIDYSRPVRVDLVASVPQGVPMRLSAPSRPLTAHPGELMQTEFVLENLSDRPLVAQAIPSYDPPLMAKYFKKIECFCFREQRLAPGERRTMPLMFVLDRKMPRDLPTIALAYTMYESPSAPKP
ncbi:cytochrome c oxidase assembly protein subunit 11 [Sulfuritortus calidifontis]|uniref:Cytochrome c oxidase assembly protein CtaG n=1 Tax=Sulfuritortus calidifontis TaxID=1914471 RepID=A0A4R3JZU0_9PROT|nr:cytochrome c oxidase assembly protein [Sulfuritortus calidifontis]TCS73400.1 cytochrome c oxidase assembly protein subunit 11 [Sulfuritortus calidifontis]